MDQNTQPPFTPPTHAPEQAGIPQPASPVPPVGQPANPAQTPPQQPVTPKKSNKLFLIIAGVTVLLVAVMLAIMLTSGPKKAPVTAVPQPSMPAPTQAMMANPTPASAEGQIDSVNVTEDNMDLQKVDKDVQGL